MTSQDRQATPSDEADTAHPELAFDTSVPHPARRYDYWLGGKDNFAADRASGDAIEAVFPTIRVTAVENRRFLARAVRFLTAEVGIDQFLDVGTGIPTANNTHEVAQQVNPAATVVYVDNDPIVLAHARALLNSHPNGATAYIDADLRQPETILTDPALAATLDLSRPVALMLVSVMHFFPDQDEPHAIVHQLAQALPADSYLVLSHASGDFVDSQPVDRASCRYPSGVPQPTPPPGPAPPTSACGPGWPVYTPPMADHHDTRLPRGWQGTGIG
ncbi:MAG: SAM-dependent methyltransferase [Kineosporiaceae bacterium]